MQNIYTLIQIVVQKYTIDIPPANDNKASIPIIDEKVLPNRVDEGCSFCVVCFRQNINRIRICACTNFIHIFRGLKYTPKPTL